jgi:hypothetical protein
MSCHCSEAKTREHSSSSSSSVTGQTLIDLFRSRLIVPPKLFQVVFLHSVYNSALYFTILLLFILVTCRSQFVLYLLSFSSTGSAFSSSQTSSFCLLSKRVQTAVRPKKLHFDWCQLFLSFFSRGPKFRFHIKDWRQPVLYVILFLSISGPKLV